MNQIKYSLATLIIFLGACSPEKPLFTPKNQPELIADYTFLVKTSSPEASGEGSAHFAEHGITFHLPGEFEIGPAPNGQTHQEILAPTDRENLQRSWSTVLSQGIASSESCQTLAEDSPLAQANVRISILKNSSESALIRVDGGQICGPILNQEFVNFSGILFSLAKKHYPKKFPDECLASKDTLIRLFNSVNSCESDDDCVHVDSQYDSIPPGQVQYVALKNCSVLPSLTAANALSLKSKHKLLLRAREETRNACAQEIREFVCTAQADLGFQNHRFPARCFERKCVPGKGLPN
jgi:hypothetical protein